MKNILGTWALLLVLPWKLTGGTTLKPNSTRQHEYTHNHHETPAGGHESTMFSTKNIALSLKPNGEASHSPGSTRQHKNTYKHHETTTRGEETTTPSTINNNLSLKTNSETSYSPSSTRLYNGTSKDQTTTKTDEPTTFFLKNQEKYTTEDGKNVSSSKSPPQTSEHQHITKTSHANHPMNAMTASTGESTSSSHLSSSPFMTEMTQNMPKEVITTRNDQTLQNFTITNHRPTRGNETTRSAEKETFKPQTDITTQFQKASSIFNQSVQSAKTLTTKWSSPPQESEESTHLPTLNITDSNGTLDTINEGKKDTATYPLNTLTNTGHNPTANTVVGTTGSTEAMNANATYEITTKDMITEGKPSNRGKTFQLSRSTIPTTQTENTKTTLQKSIMNNNKRHPGPIVASLIGSILFLMFVAFVVVLVRSRKLKKKQMENPDWAGPSPFIEADIHPNLPTDNEDAPFSHQESKRISLYSFLPQQLSKRFSTMSPLDEAISLENTQASSTFGQHHFQPLNGKATPDQIQTQGANSSPAELPSDPNVPETVSVPLENNENIQTTTKLNEEGIQFPPEETHSGTRTPFEDVDLNLSVANNAESKTPTDAIHIPSPSPPVTPS